MEKIKSSEITPEHLYLSRRKFIKGVGAAAASALLLKACAPAATDTPVPTPVPSSAGGTAEPAVGATPTASANMDELGDPLNTYEAITNYNNYYEFTIDKQRVAKLAENFVTSPWQVEVGGLVNNPKTYDMDDLLKFEQEERIYRLRCVEAWSMVIPWQGFPLSKLLAEVEPQAEAKYVRFETIYDPDQMKALGFVYRGMGRGYVD